MIGSKLLQKNSGPIKIPNTSLSQPYVRIQTLVLYAAVEDDIGSAEDIGSPLVIVVHVGACPSGQ